MKVLIACEFSGIVRDAFWRRNHYAVSCDLLPTENLGLHMQGDVRDVLDLKWDLMVAFPPCRYLAVSGARWFKGREREQEEALNFIRELLDAPIHRIALENPVGVISTKIRKPDQYVQPWMFGHGETKKTCLWLKNLPLLEPTDIVEGREGRVWKESPGPDRWKRRSRTYQGIAEAMADQWGNLQSLETIMMDEEIAKAGNCLPRRKRHYFGQHTGWGGGMGNPPQKTCLWCGKVNPRWEKNQLRSVADLK